MSRIYTEKEAETYGKRRICYKEGHEFQTGIDRMIQGGIQMQYDRKPNEAIAACDLIRCLRCDAVFAVTYPEIGTKQ